MTYAALKSDRNQTGGTVGRNGQNVKPEDLTGSDVIQVIWTSLIINTWQREDSAGTYGRDAESSDVTDDAVRRLPEFTLACHNAGLRFCFS